MVAKSDNHIVIAIPSKGSLYESTLEFLSFTGLPVKYGNERQYTASLSGIENISVLFQRAEEVPKKVADGAADLGITGEDLFAEQAIQLNILVPVLRDLGYGHARLVVAVPATWIDVSSMEDLPELALSFRLKHQRPLRVATKFPNLARKFLAEHDVFDYTLVESMGATEGAPSSGVADLVIDLTSSGRTLSENHLKILKDGIVISSQACLIGSRQIANWSEPRLERLEIFLDIVESYLRGRQTYNLQTAVHRSKLAELSVPSAMWRLAYSLPTNEETDIEGKEDSVVVIRMTCPRNHLHRVIRRLRISGANEVIVTQPEYVFRGQSESFHQLKRVLKKAVIFEQDES
jgi:ATP phosphoribosyltransferase